MLVSDVTKIRDYAKEKQKSQMMSIYFSQVAHDLKTPINTVLSVNSQLIPLLSEDQS